MPEYDNTNRITIFKNDRKQPGSKQPDYQGNLNVNGEEFKVSLWKRTSKKGVAFLSGQIQEPRTQRRDSRDDFDGEGGAW